MGQQSAGNLALNCERSACCNAWWCSLPIYLFAVSLYYCCFTVSFYAASALYWWCAYTVCSTTQCLITLGLLLLIGQKYNFLVCTMDYGMNHSISFMPFHSLRRKRLGKRQDFSVLVDLTSFAFDKYLSQTNSTEILHFPLSATSGKFSKQWL